MVYQIWEHQFWTHKLKKCQLTKKSLKPGLNSFILKQLYHWKSSQRDSHKAFFCVCVLGGGGVRFTTTRKPQFRCRKTDLCGYHHPNCIFGLVPDMDTIKNHVKKISRTLCKKFRQCGKKSLFLIFHNGSSIFFILKQIFMYLRNFMQVD